MLLLINWLKIDVGVFLSRNHDDVTGSTTRSNRLNRLDRDPVSGLGHRSGPGFKT